MRKSRLFVVFTALLVLVSLGATTMAKGSINARNPEAGKAGASAVIVPPLLVPPDDTGYVEQALGPVVASDGRPVAQFAAIPSQVGQSLAVRLPDNAPLSDDKMIAYTVLASVRYSGVGGSVRVTTTRPSSAAVQQPTSFGNRTVQLSNGTTAWISTGMPNNAPNRVVFVKDDLIITVAGDLDIELLQKLAATIVVR